MPKAPVKRFRRLPDDEQSRVIEMAWEDRTPFEAIETLFGLAEPDVIEVMRHQLKPASFRFVYGASVSPAALPNIAHCVHLMC
ncbi:hypothetical protein KUC_0654 [Vreelandella boliviensis LC1]|uniref:DUF2805 domain-containing protein n=1 Tax=Vreelandella boliviensis LC1 TaxID=1072583 RepID=A0A7U9GGT1_9GAMM|nr:hypothetical protein KUC_0654 [Halomonas boliviensis LC1]